VLAQEFSPLLRPVEDGGTGPAHPCPGGKDALVRRGHGGQVPGEVGGEGGGEGGREGRRACQLKAGLSNRACFPQREVYQRGNLRRKGDGEVGQGRVSCGQGDAGGREIRRKGWKEMSLPLMLCSRKWRRPCPHRRRLRPWL